MWADQGLYDTIMAQTANIGQGGFCMQFNQELFPGTKLDIQIDFTDKTPAFKCKGVVVRCQQVTNRDFQIGVQFDLLSQLKEAYLEGKISKLVMLEQKASLP